MIDAIQQKYLDKISKSEDFSGSKVYKSYLTYLVEASNDTHELKESIIAFDFFGKDNSFNPATDATVRTHTYNLRKKLDNYYYKEGSTDKYRITIPKGQYQAIFELASEAEVENNKWGADSNSNTPYLVGIIVLLVAILIGLTWHVLRLTSNLGEYQSISKNDVIWGDYLNSDLPILIAVGDHFFFDEYSEDYKSIIGVRHRNVNSMSDFDSLKMLFPDRDLQPAIEPYFPYHSIWSIPPILSIFYSVKQQPILRKSSILTPQMLDEYNMVFLGSIKTLYNLEHILSKSDFGFEISPHRVFYTPPDSTQDSVSVFETKLHSTGQNEDLVLAVKLPGPVNNSIFIIASFHSLGAPEIARYFADTARRKKFEELMIKKYGEIPRYFETLFRVTGIDKTAYKTDLLIYSKLPEE